MTIRPSTSGWRRALACPTGTMRRKLLPLLLAAAAACVDAPTAANSEALDAGDPLALTFDQLADQARVSGDVARVEGFTSAAIAARAGVTPSLLNVRMGTVTEVFEAFVSTVDWNLGASVPVRVPAHRTLTAWRRGTDGVTRILSFTTPSDSAPILSPLILSPTGPVAAPFAGASAFYQETTRITSLGTNAANAPVTDAYWMALSGYVRIRETSSGAVCPVEPSKVGVTGVVCRQARFSVRFDVAMQRLLVRPYTFTASSESRRVSLTTDQAVSGYKLVLSCASPTASKGCG